MRTVGVDIISSELSFLGVCLAGMGGVGLVVLRVIFVGWSELTVDLLMSMM